MEIFDVLTLLCGLALFLYGMDVMGDALKKSAGRRLKTVLGHLTANKYKGFLLGLGVTAVIQSSSATTVMVVGFVNSGAMLLSQAVSVIMGANVGTAVTAWLTALNGIEGGAGATAWLVWLKPDAWMPVLALTGIGLILFSKRSRSRDVGAILMGFSVLMVGMDLMAGAVSGLKGDPGFTSLLTAFKNPVLGVLAGTVLTAVVQSSSASVGILQALSSTGAISFAAAIPIVMGQNIGTCVTALISSAGANKNGKRAALIHLYFNLIGVTVWMGLYYLVGGLLSAASAFDLLRIAEETPINMWGIAAVHTVFKLLSVLLLFPASSLLEKLATATVRGDDRKGDAYTAMLDPRLLDTPAVAVERARAVAGQMATLAADCLRRGLEALDTRDEKAAQSIRAAEERVDLYEDALGDYLVKLSARDMDPRDGRRVTGLLHVIGDLERISDHAVNLLESAEEMRDKEISFSAEAEEELRVLRAAVSEVVTLATEALTREDLEQAARVEPLEQVIDGLCCEIKTRHIHRLTQSACTVEQGFILSDILTNLERVSDHCSNLAGHLISMSQDPARSPTATGLHDYLRRVKAGSMGFDRLFRAYAEKYTLPENKEN